MKLAEVDLGTCDLGWGLPHLPHPLPQCVLYLAVPEPLYDRDTGRTASRRFQSCTVICISRWVSPRVQIRCLRSRQSAAPQSEASRAVPSLAWLIGCLRRTPPLQSFAVLDSSPARHALRSHRTVAVASAEKGFSDRTPETRYRRPSELVGARINQADSTALCRLPPPTADWSIDQTDQWWLMKTDQSSLSLASPSSARSADKWV